ncbi:MAG: hypothetical protein BLITH_1496 [Brockia lithotrophica]|uniref:Uncharacterized protein n=1 Tax=Brockia lithotrophica TaxID=933949 RepID=A0A2T5G5F5_9BACL|nr:MAG: hypothetical protein BLITH_1496 [Brockia lithotrophica]
MPFFLRAHTRGTEVRRVFCARREGSAVTPEGAYAVTLFSFAVIVYVLLVVAMRTV